jgi:hypothetical protein
VSYQEQLKKHLGQYKKTFLGIDADGEFVKAGKRKLYRHILPIADKWRNLFPEALSVRDHSPGFRFHHLFHHLNSSQALAINLFFPYFNGGIESKTVLLDALGSGGSLLTWSLEDVPDAAENSNVDATWTTSDGTKTLCEVKLSELGVGTAANDAEHRKKLRETYAPRLRGHLKPESLEEVPFFSGYQFYRMIWHMIHSENNRLVFLLPRANDSLRKSLEILFTRVLPPTSDRVRAVYLEDVLQKLQTAPNCPDNLRVYASRLQDKYIIPAL